MADEVSLVTKRRDYSDIVKLQEPEILEEFLEQPLSYIPETITGALAVGSRGVFAAGGRIVQGLLKGKHLQQFAAEFKKLRETGRIPDDFADRRYGFQTWVELMKIIDEESPDPDKLEALKAMFFAVNKVNASDGEQIAAYQLWQIAKTLDSGELFLLKIVHEQSSKYDSNTTYSTWESRMAKAAGHEITGLVGLHEKRLTEFGLLTPRQWGDGSGITPTMARLTALGFAFCKNIENYQIEMRTSD